MQLVALRLLALLALVGLYALHPLAGIAALAAGFGYVAGQYRSQHGNSQTIGQRATCATE